MLLRPFARLQTAGQVKPQGVPRIDWTHPLAQGLLFYGFDTGMGLIVDLVAGRSMNTVGQPSQGTSEFGTGTNYSATVTTSFNSDSIIRTATAAAPWTVATGYYSTSGRANGIPFCRTSNNNTGTSFVNWAFQTQNSAGSTNMNAALNSGGFYVNIGSQATLAAQTFTSVALVANSASTASFFANGVQSGAASTGLTIASADVNDAICFGGDSSAAAVNPMAASLVFYGGFWGRALSSDELALLHRDPYCFLLPPEGEMPALFTAAAGGSFLAAWARNSNLPVIGTGNY